jgi:hypothetical protein
MDSVAVAVAVVEAEAAVNANLFAFGGVGGCQEVFQRKKGPMVRRKVRRYNSLAYQALVWN